jgi:hypothetical protein
MSRQPAEMAWLPGRRDRALAFSHPGAGCGYDEDPATHHHVPDSLPTHPYGPASRGAFIQFPAPYRVPSREVFF